MKLSKSSQDVFLPRFWYYLDHVEQAILHLFFLQNISEIEFDAINRFDVKLNVPFSYLYFQIHATALALIYPYDTK